LARRHVGGSEGECDRTTWSRASRSAPSSTTCTSGTAPRRTRRSRADLGHRKELTPLLDSSWYPFAIFDEVIRAVATRFFAGRLAGLRDVGNFSAEKALTTVYRSYVRAADIPGFLGRLGSLHQTYYNQGEMTAEMDPSGGGATVSLLGAPVHSDADNEVTAGFLLGACRLLGKPAARCACRVAGGAVRWELHW
jgi:hypothetical protein